MFEEVVCVLIFLHLFLPLRTLEIVVDLHQMLKEIEGKYPASFIDNEKGEES